MKLKKPIQQRVTYQGFNYRCGTGQKKLTWTKQAIDCYNSGARCENCIIYRTIENPCLMKKTLIELVRVLGKPPEKFIGLLPHTNRLQNEIVKIILSGITTKKDIAKELNLQEGTIQSNLITLYSIAESQGFKFLSKRDILQ